MDIGRYFSVDFGKKWVESRQIDKPGLIADRRGIIGAEVGYYG